MPTEQTYPLSLVEKNMLVLNKHHRDADILNRPLKILGNLCEETFTESYRWVVKQCPILKTRFKIDELTGTYVKVLDRPAVISRHDYTGMSEAGIHEKLVELSRSGFDVQADSLFAMHLIKCDENEYIFHIRCHHICSDGATCLKLLKNTFEAYLSYRAIGRYPELTMEYTLPDYVQFEEEFSKTQKGRDSKAYWSNVLMNQTIEDETRNIPQSIESSDVELDLTGDDFAVVKNLVAYLNVTIFAYVVAGFQELLPQDMLISTTVSTRIRKKHRQEYGAMFRYALLNQGPKGELFEDKANRLRRELFKAQRTPYCCETIGMHGNPDYKFDYKKTALANYYKIAADSEGIGAMAFGSGDSSKPMPISPELSVKTLEVPIRLVPYSLYLSIGEFQSKLNLKLIYNIELYSAPEAMEILETLRYILLQPTPENCIGMT